MNWLTDGSIADGSIETQTQGRAVPDPHIPVDRRPQRSPAMRKEALPLSVLSAVIWLATVPGRCGAG
jgi:hypothetical protein